MSADFESSPYVKLVGRLVGHKGRVAAMAWSPNGQWLASCSLDGVLHLWSSSLRVTNRPRVSRQRHTAAMALTCVAWSDDGRYIASGSTAGWVDIWQGSEFTPVEHGDRGARAAIRCLAWAGARQSGELRLAFAGDDRVVHFRNYSDWDRPDIEKGLGHEGSILTLAWSPVGDTIVTGTDVGTIGVWEPSQRDNQLRDVLDWRGIRAHDGAVTALAWSLATDVLASGGRDGRLHLWNVKGRALIGSLDCEEEVLEVQFAHDGRLLVVQTRDHIRFLSVKPLHEIAAYYLPAVLDPTTTRVAFDGASRLAVIDPEDGATIAVWQVDAESVLKESDLTRRRYTAVNVPLLGEASSGRTNLALALAGETFNAKHEPHAFRVHPVRATVVDQESGATEIRDVALWDLPSRADHSLVQQIHAGHGIVVLMVLDPSPGLEVAAPANLQRWRQTLRRWKELPRRERPFSLVVITKCDTVSTPPTPDDSLAIARELGFAVLFTSAKSGLGIAELRATILAAVKWEGAGVFHSVETFALIRTYAQSLRDERHYFMSVREFREALRRVYPFLGERLSDENEFRNAIRLLEIIGEAEYFERRDEVLVAPSYYHAYAAAMIAAAQKDETGMGRLPLQEAEFGRGRQMNLEESERLADVKQEARLLGLTIDDMVHEKRVAQIVATDGVSYLVFPMSLMRVRDGAEPVQPSATAWQFAGAVDDVFSSLVIRLLGLKHHYSKPDLWKNEAQFVPSSGGCCGIRMMPNDSGDEAELEVYFGDATGNTEQTQFVNLVRSHLASHARSVSSDVSRMSTPEIHAKRTGRPSLEVYFSWKADRADTVTVENVAAIISALEARGVRVVGESSMRPGESRHEHLLHLERCRVAAFLVTGPLSKAQELDYYRLEPTGCRVIPVILPNARKNFVMPALLRRWGHIDFRGKFLDVTPLERAIVNLTEAGPISRSGSSGNVFLSYCRDDFEQADQLRLALEGAGHSVWWDHGDGRLPPGSDWDRVIRQAIRSSYAFILCLSARWVARSRSGVYPELIEAIGVQRGIRPTGVFIIPVRFSECEAPDIPIDVLRNLGALQRFDYFGSQAHLGELVRVLDEARRAAVAGLGFTGAEGDSPQGARLS